MPRTIEITITSQISDAQYVDLANAIWMVLRITGHKYEVQYDPQVDEHQLNAAWDQYGKDERWANRA